MDPFVMIATPCYGNMVSVPYLCSMTNFFMVAAQHHLSFKLQTIGNDSLVTRARNGLVAKFLEDPRFTHLLFIDADIGFQAKLIFRLLGFNQGVVAAAYPQKLINWQQIKSNAMRFDDKLQERSLRYNLNVTNPSKIECRDGFIKVKDVATGFMMIKREVFEKMIEAYPELYYQPDHAEVQGGPVSMDFHDAHGDGQTTPNKQHSYWAFFDCMIDPTSQRYLSEDYTFCRRWQQIGGEIWCDVTEPLSHTGTYVFQGDISTQVNSA